eukprot:g44792.t1
MFYFIGNLALSDLFAGVAYIFNIVFSGSQTMKLTPLQWFIREGTMFVALAASVLSLLAIAIERHAAIVKVKLYSGDKNTRMCLLIGSCWIASVLLGGLPVMGWNCLCHVNGCSTVLPLFSKNYILFCITLLSIILLSIVILYVRIYLIVRSSHCETAAPQTLALLKTVTIVLGVFIVCWAPTFIMLLLDFAYTESNLKILHKAEIFLALSTLNSAMNPIIYTLRSRDMRRAFLRILCCCSMMENKSRCHISVRPDLQRMPLPFIVLFPVLPAWDMALCLLPINIALCSLYSGTAAAQQHGPLPSDIALPLSSDTTLCPPAQQYCPMLKGLPCLVTQFCAPCYHTGHPLKDVLYDTVKDGTSQRYPKKQ